MSDRLKDLQRQRALAQEQLDWLDREIARESAATTPASPLAAGTPVKAQPRKTALSKVPFADDIIAQYQKQPGSVHSEVKRGCLTALFAAFAVLGLTLAAVWFFKYR